MTLAIYTLLGQSIQAVIRGLNLDRLPAAQVYWFEFATDRLADGVQLPCVQISLPQEGPKREFSTTESSVWRFSFLVTLGKASNQGNDWDDQFKAWSEAIVFAFDSQKLAGIPEAFWCLAEPKQSTDPTLWRQRNVSIGQMLVTVKYVVAR